MQQEKKRFYRLIYRSAFRYLGALLVISMLTGSLLGGGVFYVNALCAAGFVMIAWAWFTYLKITGMRPFAHLWPKKKKRVPEYLRKEKNRRFHRPAFLRDSEDFDDDLTAQTVSDAESFTARQRDTARAWGRAICGVILVLLSFITPMI